MCRTWGPPRPRSSSRRAPSSSREVGGGHAALTSPFWPDLGPATAFFFASMKLSLGHQLWIWCPCWTLLSGGLPQSDLWGGQLLLKIVIELHVEGSLFRALLWFCDPPLLLLSGRCVGPGHLPVAQDPALGFCQPSLLL